ncbi:HlyD family efflux transporter periplasmic adaptor subunit [Micromonospora sp. M12]
MDDAVAVGGRVTAGTPVLTVVDIGQLGLLAEVDETDVLLVKAGVTATVELDAVTGASYDATVRSVDVLPTSSAQGGVTYRVRLALGAGKLAEDEPAPAPPGHERDRASAGTRGGRRGDRSGLRGVLRRRPGRGLGGPRRQGWPGAGHRGRPGVGPGADPQRHPTR